MISENNYEYISDKSENNYISKKLKIDYHFDVLSEFETNNLSFTINISRN